MGWNNQSAASGSGARPWALLGLVLRPLLVLGRALLAEWKPLLAGVVGALLVQAFVVNIYGVRKHSMEPTLHAEEGRTGDRVAVFKLAYLLGGPRRWELCVFRKEREGHNVVKRVVGLPGEWIRIEDGDVWVGPGPSDLRLLKKSPEELMRLAVPLADLGVRPLASSEDPIWEFDPARWARDGERLVARPGPNAPARLEWRGLLHGGYLEDGGESSFSTIAVRDFGCELEWEPGSGEAGLAVALQAMGRTFEARVQGGELLLRADGAERLRLPIGPAGAGRPLSLALFQADLRLFLRAGGSWRTVELDPWPDPLEVARLRPRWNGLSIEATGAGGRLGGLRVLRDLYFTDIQGGRHGTGRDPAFCDVDEYFLLGDNSGVSEDSRHYGPVKASDLVGRPFLVLLPLRRLRWL